MFNRTYVAIAIFGLWATLIISTPPDAGAAPAMPTNLTPDGTTVSGIPPLQWDRVPGAATYDVELSESPGFGSAIWSVDDTVNRRAVPTTALPAGELYWRVRATDPGGVTSGWATASFTVGSHAAPLPLTPADGASLPQPQEPPQMSWRPVPGAYSYEIQVSRDPGLAGAEDYTSRTTSFSFTSTPRPGTLYWHVRGVRSGGRVTDWSSTWSYTIQPLAQPTNPTPDSSPDSLLNDVVLEWDAVPGAYRYEIRVSPDQNFSAGTTSTAMTFGTRWSPPATFNNDQYWWQVRAYDVEGRTSDWPVWPERTWQFERRWQFGGTVDDPPRTDPATPELVHPADQVNPAVTDPFFYQWEPVRLASRYVLQMGTDPNFSPDTYDECSTKATTFTPTGDERSGQSCLPFPGYTYYWRVQAVDDPTGVVTPWSDIHTFTYRPGVVPTTAPADGSTVDVPTMRWNDAPGAEKYEVTWQYGSVVKTAETYSTSFTPTTRITPADATVTWWVQAIYHNGDEAAIPLNPPSFTLSGDSPAAGAVPQLLDPVEGRRFPALSWTPVTGASYYRLLVGTPGTGSFTPLATKHPYPAGTDPTLQFIRPGSYDYRVVAYDSSNVQLSMSATGSFSVGALAAPTDQAAALSGVLLDSAERCGAALPSLCGGLTQTPVLDWAPVTGASYYLVYLARDVNLTNLVYDGAVTQNTRWTPTELLPDSQAGQAYYWVIRPCKAPGVCAPDPTRATNAFDKTSRALQPLSPTNGGIEPGGDTVTFSWRDYLRTNTAGDTGPLVHTSVEAATYRIQVSSSPTFQQILDSAVVDQTTYTATNRLYPEGPLWWRVTPIDGSGNDLTPSPIWQTEKHSAPVVQTSPANGAASTSTPALRWRPQPNAASYQVEVYRNNDTNFSSVNRVVNTTVRQSALSLTNPLPVSPDPYVWRIRRIDGSGNYGPWSATADTPGQVWSFRVRGAAPKLITPAAGANVSAVDSLFTWRPRTGAAYYRYELRRVGGSTSSVNTVALAYAPRGRLSDGAWEWRVSSIDTGGSVMATSAWRGFSVDSTAPTVVDQTPVETAKPTANVRATFSEVVRGTDSASMKLIQVGSAHPVSASVTWDPATLRATLNPARDLRVGKAYKVVLTSAISDRAGNALAKTSWQFRVRR